MTLRALVIDSEPDTRRLISLRLGYAGFRVSSALDCRDGLEKAIAAKPDVVVLDVPTPDGEGFAIAREIRRRLIDPAPAIIMLSARDCVASILEGIESGADDYLVKPFAPRELIERTVVALVRRGRAPELPEGLQNDRSHVSHHQHAGAS